MSKRRSDTAAPASPATGSDRGIAGFFVSSEATRRGHGDLVRRSIVEKGFEVLLDLAIAGELQDPLSAWLGARRLQVVAGEVAAVLFAYDLMPIASADGVSKTANLENEREIIATGAADKEVNRLSRPERSYVAVTSTGSSAEAWSLLQALAPDRIDWFRKETAVREAAFATPPPLRELSSIACRAKVELVDHQQTVAVRKTFRPGAERYLQRELAVLQELGPNCAAIPKLFDHGPNFLVMEYIDEADQLGLPQGEGLLPLRLVRELAQFVRTCVAHGFDPVDLKPDGNAIYTRHGLKVIDYEFWRRCPAGTRPEDCYCLAGLPPDYDGDRPMGLTAPFRPYPAKWIPFTGLSMRSFLYDPPWLQRPKRCGWPAVWAFRRVARFAARRVRVARPGPQSA